MNSAIPSETETVKSTPLYLDSLIDRLIGQAEIVRRVARALTKNFSAEEGIKLQKQLLDYFSGDFGIKYVEALRDQKIS